MKVFILKPSSLGDVVQALPVLRLLKQHLREAEIFWWIDSALAPLLQDDPDLAGLILFERDRWRSPWHWPEAWQSGHRIRTLRFDWVIDLQSLLRSGFVAWMANGSLTIGLDDAREGARGFYDIVVPRPSYYTHAVDWYLATLPKLGVPVHRQFTWLPPRPAAAEAIQRRFSPQPGRWVALQPGARWLNKRWPAEYFGTLILQMSHAFSDTRFVILGSKAETDLGATITRAAPQNCLDLTGKISLPEMIEWVRLCSAMVTNDTGPMHIAAALGTPVIGIFGPTEPRRTGPYDQLEGVLQAKLPCVPCMKDTCHWPTPLECLQVITPDLVADQLARLLSSKSAGFCRLPPRAPTLKCSNANSSGDSRVADGV